MSLPTQKDYDDLCAGYNTVMSSLQDAEAKLAECTQERDDLKGHVGRCVKCRQFTCGYCGIGLENGDWVCERCHGFGPLVKAESELAALRSACQALAREIGAEAALVYEVVGPKSPRGHDLKRWAEQLAALALVIRWD